MPRLRAHVTLIEQHELIYVESTSVSKDFRPAQWRWLWSWLDEGWFPIDLTGNGERDCALVLEQKWGEPMRLAAFVSVKEKDDGIKIKARTEDVPGLPDDWDKGLLAWTKDGWDLVQVTGNREHGWGWLLVKDAPDDALGAT